MKTSHGTHTTILACLEHNRAEAKTKAMREFTQQKLDDYKAHLAEIQKPKPTYSNAMERFCDALNAEVSHRAK